MCSVPSFSDSHCSRITARIGPASVPTPPAITLTSALADISREKALGSMKVWQVAHMAPAMPAMLEPMAKTMTLWRRTS